MNLSLDLAVLVATFAIIFPAELPDKSFIATLVLATRYPRLWVWLGATLAFGVQMLIAVVAGQLLSYLPRTLVLGVTALLFAIGAVLLIKGGLTARADELAEEEQEMEEIEARAAFGKHGLAAFATTFAVIFTAEWGDLTQLVTAGQAARTDAPCLSSSGRGSRSRPWRVSACSSEPGCSNACRCGASGSCPGGCWPCWRS